MNLHPHQEESVRRALAAPLHRWIMASETRVGKTGEALTVARRHCEEIRAAQRTTQWYPTVLIVCPAVVRSNWMKQLSLWWPEHPPAALINYGRKVKLPKAKSAARDAAYSAPIQVISYNLVDEVPADSRWDVIILDECHRLKSASTAWSKHIRKIVDANPMAAIIGATATLMPDKPQDAYNVLDTIWPGRFGKKWKFQQRYQLEERCEYAASGKKFIGVNPVHIGELRKRIASLSTRTTRKDIAHLLPPYDVQALRIKAKQVKLDIWDEKAITEALYSYGLQKIPHVIDWFEDAAQAASHVAILTHHKSLMRNIGEKLCRETDRPIYLINGSLYPNAEARNAALDEAAKQPAAVIVATMDSIGIGIDLAFVTQALVAELSYRPDVVIQAIGRFGGMNCPVPAATTILVCEGTLDEVIANKLEAKIGDINAAIKSGSAESALTDSLSDHSFDWKEELRNAIQETQGQEEDGYTSEWED